MAQVMKNFAELGSIFGLKEVAAPKKVAQQPKKQSSTKKKVVSKTAIVMKTPPVYKTLKTFEGVVMKLPKKSGFMTYKPAFTTANGDSVSEHWHNGKALGGKVYLNVFFYKVTAKDLGKRIIATVKVIEKKMADGRKFIIMDVHHTPAAACQYNFSMPKDGTGEFIIDEQVKEKLAFLPRKHDKLKL